MITRYCSKCGAEMMPKITDDITYCTDVPNLPWYVTVEWRCPNSRWWRAVHDEQSSYELTDEYQIYKAAHPVSGIERPMPQPPVRY